MYFQSKKASKCMSCEVCTAFDGIQRMTVSKRAGQIYKRVRNAQSGELFPVKVGTACWSHSYCDPGSLGSSRSVEFRLPVPARGSRRVGVTCYVVVAVMNCTNQIEHDKKRLC